MAKHRTYGVEFKRQIFQEHPGGETQGGRSRRHDISRYLIPIWAKKY